MYKQFVDFHGELLLLVHWSILAYTGLVKILKKHHKRTGLLVKAPHLDNLLSQPFCSVEVSMHFKQAERLGSTLLCEEWLLGCCLSPFAMWRLSCYISLCSAVPWLGNCLSGEAAAFRGTVDQHCSIHAPL